MNAVEWIPDWDRMVAGPPCPPNHDFNVTVTDSGRGPVCCGPGPSRAPTHEVKGVDS